MKELEFLKMGDKIVLKVKIKTASTNRLFPMRQTPFQAILK